VKNTPNPPRNFDWCAANFYEWLGGVFISYKWSEERVNKAANRAALIPTKYTHMRNLFMDGTDADAQESREYTDVIWVYLASLCADRMYPTIHELL